MAVNAENDAFKTIPNW